MSKGIIAKAKTKFRNVRVTTIALILLLTTSALATNILTVNAANRPMTAFLALTPDPVGVGQSVTVNMFLSFQRGNSDPIGAFENLSLIITKPDGTNQTKGPLKTDYAGVTFTYYTPDQIGEYHFQLIFPGQQIGASFHTPAISKSVPLTVQQEPIAYLPNVPLPTDYWKRPISAENTEWQSISGNWLSYPSQGKYNATGNFNPYTKAPNSAHVVWTKPLAFGGIVGGEFVTNDYFTGKPYQAKFNPAIIMNGVLYYDTPDPPRYGFSAVDIRTGESLWYKNYTQKIAIGQLWNLETGNQKGLYAFLWSFGSTWSLFDAFTGNWIMDFANATGGGGFGPAATMNTMFDENGNLIAYYLNSAQSSLYLWNSSVCFKNNGLLPTTGGGMAQFAPNSGTYDWRKGIQWNVTTPIVPGQSIVALGSGVVLASTWGGMAVSPGWEVHVGYDALTGTALWVENRTLPVGALSFGSNLQMMNGVYCEYVRDEMSLYGYNAITGKQIWGPIKPEKTNDWGYYTSPLEGGWTVTAYGKLYTANYDGYVHAFNLSTGKPLWDFSSGSTGMEAPYTNYPFTGGVMAADEKIFANTNSMYPTSPMFKGFKLFAIDAEKGTNIWNISGHFQGPAVADGYMVTFNDYDQQVYAFGKGKTTTTIDAPTLAVTKGSSVILRGTVTDQSPGAKDTPAISDDNMSPWMEYLYMQKPKPTNAVGVPVTISVVDSNGNYRDIGSVTSDSDGFFSLNWKPDIEGKYTVYASFAGSESYWSSHAVTAFAVDPATPTPAPTEAPAESTADMYFVPAIAGLFVLIIIVAIVLAMLMLRKRP